MQRPTEHNGETRYTGGHGLVLDRYIHGRYGGIQGTRSFAWTGPLPSPTRQYGNSNCSTQNPAVVLPVLMCKVPRSLAASRHSSPTACSTVAACYGPCSSPAPNANPPLALSVKRFRHAPASALSAAPRPGSAALGTPEANHRPRVYSTPQDRRVSQPLAVPALRPS